MIVPKRRVTRLFVERDLSGDTLALDEREAHYLGTVLRLQPGDELIAFNGLGTERHAAVGALLRRSAELELRALHPAIPESALELTLLQALPKADAMDLIVQKATELGVRRIVPAYSEFSVVKLDEERAERRVEHWRRIAQGACEQCGRHTPPQIEPPAPLAASLEHLYGATTKLALDPTAETAFAATAAPAGGLIVAVGPEGGFGATDWRRLDGAAFKRVSLGARILRAETAAIAIGAIAQSRWGDL
jgi:16S rRNA (uracil1498-N3)-methyltransferase